MIETKFGAASAFDQHPLNCHESFLSVILFVSFRFSECRSASGISSDASGSSMEKTVASSSRTDTAMFCHNFILNHGRKDDDSQVHIDLTDDDLLHVVYTLLHFKIIFFFL